MFLAGNLGTNFHPVLFLHFLEPFQPLYPGTLERARMSPGFPYSSAENMNAEVVKALGRHHHLQLRFGAARAGNDYRGNTLVKESPFRHGDSVKCSFHNYLIIFFIRFASRINSSMRDSS